MSDMGGVWSATVVDNADPEQQRRLQVVVPVLFGDSVLGWARPCLPPGFDGALPATGDRIWVMFEAANPARPVWIGTW